MEFVHNLGDTSNTPEIAVGGIARVEIIDNCMVRVTFHRPVADRDVTLPAVQLIWTIPAWLAARPVLAEAAAEIGKLPQPNGRDMGLSRH